MKRTQILVPLSLVLAGILILAAPTAAKSSKTAYEFYEIVCLDTPGISWQAGTPCTSEGR